MTLERVAGMLGADIMACRDNLGKEIESACGSDLMSDVLAFAKDKNMLITGLVNPQVIRTAEMLDIFAVAFVRGKKPTAEMIDMAEERSMTLISTGYTMYSACGLLFENGVGRNETVY